MSQPESSQAAQPEITENELKKPPHRLKPLVRQLISAQRIANEARKTARGHPLELELEKKKPKTRVGIAMQDTSDEFKFWFHKYKKWFKLALCIICHILIVGHFIWATCYYIIGDDDDEPKNAGKNRTSKNGTVTTTARPPIFFCDEYGFLIILFIGFYLIIFYFYVFKPYIKQKLCDKVKPCWAKVNEKLSEPKVKWSICGVLVFAMLLFVIIDCAVDNDWHRMIPLAGIIVILFLFTVFSKYPGYIEIKPIISGFTIQFLFALLTIRWEVGRDIFACIGDKVSGFLDFGLIGASFVYADIIAFAFTSLSITYFVLAVVQILYYCGCIQRFVVGLGSFLQFIIGTTIVESVNAASNIFLSMVEAPIILGPYIPLLTRSEIHTIVTSGFATSAGIVLAAYINFGANPAHLIVASVLAAPASLVLSKIFYPETEHSHTSIGDIVIVKSAAENCLDAAVHGARMAIDIVLGVIANTIAFVSIVEFLDSILSWLGTLVGQYDWNLISLGSFILMPFVFLMGVPWKETQVVARVIATKCIVNEFVAYKELGDLKTEQMLQPRSIMILTYAICGFANPSSMGIIISILGTIVPQKKHLLSHIVIRAYFAGTFSNFLTACICAMLTPKKLIQ